MSRTKESDELERRWREEFGEPCLFRMEVYGELEILLRGDLLPRIFTLEELRDTDGLIATVKSILQEATV